MNKTERIFKIEQLIAAHSLVSFKDFLAELEVSRATLKRDLEYLRSRMNAPIVYDREANGYRFEAGTGGAERMQFPGMWFNASEAAGLLTMHHLLEEFQPGLLQRHIEPLKERLESLLGGGTHSSKEIRRRVRILHRGRRPTQSKVFELAAQALLNRRQLKIQYHSRTKNKISDRTISPQRLVSFRENWYLEAWSHERTALRSFAVDCIRKIELLETPAKEISEKHLDKMLGGGYGVFAGEAKSRAKLKFAPARSWLIASEQWHPSQRGIFEPDGSYVLEFPYSSDRDLVGDILRYGPEVEVLAPKELRDRCSELLSAAARRYRYT